MGRNLPIAEMVARYPDVLRNKLQDIVAQGDKVMNTNIPVGFYVK